jgi:hypothetical protein
MAGGDLELVPLGEKPFRETRYTQELQGYVDFAVGVLAISKERDAAQELVKFMSSPEAVRSSVRAASSRRPPDGMPHPPRPALVRDGSSIGLPCVSATASEGFVG